MPSNPRVEESSKIATAAERCDLPHLATRKTAQLVRRSLLRSFPVVEREAQRPPAVWALGRAGLGGCARSLFRRALQCGADPRGICLTGYKGRLSLRLPTRPFITSAAPTIQSKVQ